MLLILEYMENVQNIQDQRKRNLLKYYPLVGIEFYEFHISCIIIVYIDHIIRMICI